MLGAEVRLAARFAVAAAIGACGAAPADEPGDGMSAASAGAGAAAGSGAFFNAGGGSGAAKGDETSSPASGQRGTLGSGLGDGSCARASVALSRLVPTVEVVVDASGSMAEPFAGCDSRWQCLRDALIGDQGVITELEGAVRFGLMLYGGQIAKVEDGAVTETLDATCPRYLHVTPRLGNRDAIAKSYERANPAGGTPTAEALDRVVTALPDASLALDADIGAQVIVLVTDGDPNTCEDPANTDYGPAEAQALAAQAKHIKLFVITVADDQNLAHLQRMANLGAGMKSEATPGAPYFDPDSATALGDALRGILGEAIGCEVRLEGKVVVKADGDECRGEVTLNGEPLPCNASDGWRLLDESTIELSGSACARFKDDPEVLLDASFPCELLVVE